MIGIHQGDVTHVMTFLLVSSADHVSPVTGATPTVTVSKNGGAYAAIAGTVAEIGNGLYKITPGAADVATIGETCFHCTASGADPTDERRFVCAVDPTDATAFGLSRVDAAVSTRATPAQILATPANPLATDASGRVTVGSNADKTGYALSTFVETGTAQGGGPSTVTLRSGASGTDAFYNNEIVAIAGGTGAGQARMITGYVGATKVATLDRAWVTAPDATSTYTILPSDKVEVVLNDDKTGYALTAGEHTTVQSDVTSGLTAQGYTATRAGYLDALNGLVANILAATVETGLSVVQTLRLAASVLGGKVSGGGTTTNTFRDVNDTVNRVTATVDSNGDRSSVTLNL